LKVTADRQAAARYGLQLVKVSEADRVCMAQAGVIGSGGNSGFQALNLALQFGARRVILVGFDLNLAGGVHWHGRTPRLNNPTARTSPGGLNASTARRRRSPRSASRS
jgi:hypothetical protein